MQILDLLKNVYNMIAINHFNLIQLKCTGCFRFVNALQDQLNPV